MFNLDEFVLIGQGSEWFWTMLEFTALAITFVAIYRQLRAQHSATVFEEMASWHREWTDATFVRERLQLLFDLEGRDPSLGLPRSGLGVGNFFDRFGYLVARGHVRSIDVWQDWRPTVAFWWQLLQPYIAGRRTALGAAFNYQSFESLEREMQRLDQRQLGRPYRDPTTPAEMIESYTAVLRREEDARRGVIPSGAVAVTGVKDDSV